MTIGKHGVLTSEQARLMARDKLGDVAKGHDARFVAKTSGASLRQEVP